jgi:hypothetical protein
MRGEDAGRLGMPATGYEERPMSATWWEEPWGPRGVRNGNYRHGLRTIEAAAQRRQAAEVRKKLPGLLGALA